MVPCLSSEENMRIALMGTRGVPAKYSGFETCVEELGSRLVERGHDVTVYCRKHHGHYAESIYKGMRLVTLPSIQNKYLDTITHSFLSVLHSSFQHYDIVLLFIAGNSPVTWIPRVFGQKTVLNVDGLDWKRQKWNRLAKRYIQFAEWLATFLPNEIVTDSTVVQDYYLTRFKRTSVYIAYGSELSRRPAGEWLAKFNLQPQRYILFVGRLVPENCAHHLVEAFRGLDTDMKCVIVGDATYAADYIGQLKAMTADPRVIFTGYVFGEGYQELGSNAYAFVETSEVGGTHPALTQAMALRNCVVVNDTPENLETVGPAGLWYHGAAGGDSLREVLRGLIAAPDRVEEYRQRAAAYAIEHYSWDRVTNAYETLFNQLVAPR